MAKLALNQLQPADVILTTGKAAVSTLIKVGTWSDVSHAIVYVGGGTVIHANADGVVKESWAKVQKEVTVAKVLRHPEVDSKKQSLIVSYANNQIGKKYDYREVPGAASPGKIAYMPRLALVAAAFKTYNIFFGDRSEFFCSELVVAAYQHAGLSLGGWNPSTYAPEDLKHTKLAYIGDLV